jgi:hypothetical protein
MSIVNGFNGIVIGANANEVRILGGVVEANSEAAYNTYSGILVAPNVTDFTIRDVDFLRFGSSQIHYADIFINAGSSDRYVLSGNRCNGGITYKIFDGGAGASKFTKDNIGYNPRGFTVNQPAVPATGVGVFNNQGVDCMVYVAGGTVTGYAVGGTPFGYGGTNVGIMVPAGSSIQVFYSAAPTWKWIGA